MREVEILIADVMKSFSVHYLKYDANKQDINIFTEGVFRGIANRYMRNHGLKYRFP